MTGADWTHWLPTIIGVASGPAGAGLIVAWWKHRENTREQTDDVAMNMVGTLLARVETLESDASKERELCDAKIETLQAELKSVRSDFESVMMALAVAPEKAAEIVAMVKARREPATIGDKRQRDQRTLSTSRILRDEQAAMAAEPPQRKKTT
jgi:hypothetical protein